MPRLWGADAGRTPFRSFVFNASIQTKEDAAAGAHLIWPVIEAKHWREALFQLCWTQHGGSGLHCSITEALDLDISERDWMLERIEEQRKKEAAELRKAARKR